MAEWIETHWGQATWFGGVVASIIAWFVRLEVRLSRIENKAETLTNFTKESHDDRVKIHGEIADVHEKINRVCEITARIEGYCRARSSHPCKEE